MVPNASASDDAGVKLAVHDYHADLRNAVPAGIPEIAKIAVSVKDAIGIEVPRELILAAFCNHFEALYEDAVAGDDVPFYSWKDRLVTLGRQVTATGGGSVIKGKAVDVAEDGALLIQQLNGKKVRVEAGDVTLSAR